MNCTHSDRYIVVPSKAKSFISVIEEAKKDAEGFKGYKAYDLVKTVVSHPIPCSATYAEHSARSMLQDCLPFCPIVQGDCCALCKA